MTNKTEEHIQEDIILPKKKATRYIHRYGYCNDCHKTFATTGKDELYKSYIGPVAKSTSVFLKYDIKMSGRDIERLFYNLFDLRISTGAITGFRNQLSKHGVSTYDKIHQELKKSPFVNFDETGWRNDGDPMWLWNVSNRKVVFNHIDKSRGNKVVEYILGKKFDGTIISDFLSAYNKISAKAKQRCLVHLIRELTKVIKNNSADKIITSWCYSLLELIKSAISLSKQFKNTYLYYLGKRR